jgi:DNA invertase Pin-like site-specific DNA recombinase
MAWSVDRLGRSLQDLVSFLSEIHAAGVDLFLHQQGVDTTTPGGKAMFQMLGVFAEFERSIIQERVRAGLRRAKAEGKRLGRPRIAADIEARISGPARIPPTASVRSRRGSASTPVPFSGSVALSTPPHNATPQIALTPSRLRQSAGIAEARMISERSKAALAVARRRGVQLGGYNKNPKLTAEGPARPVNKPMHVFRLNGRRT